MSLTFTSTRLFSLIPFIPYQLTLISKLWRHYPRTCNIASPALSHHTSYNIPTLHHISYSKMAPPNRQRAPKTTIVVGLDFGTT